MTRKVIATPLVKLLTVQVRGLGGVIVAKVDQVVPSVEAATTYEVTLLPGNEAAEKLTVAVWLPAVAVIVPTCPGNPIGVAVATAAGPLPAALIATTEIETGVPSTTPLLIVNEVESALTVDDSVFPPRVSVMM